VRLVAKSSSNTISAAGHTNGDAMILFPAHRVLHTGDLFVQGPRSSTMAMAVALSNGQTRFRRFLRPRLRSRYPGHGPIMTKADLVAWNNTLKSVRSKVSELKRKGVARDDMGNQLKLEEFGWKPSANFARAIPSIYDEVR